MREVVFDIETNGFLDKLTKMHVISWQDNTMDTPTSGYSLEAVEEVYSAEVIIGHNICRFDLDAIEKVYGIRPAKEVLIVDTLALSWYLDHERGARGLRYGLESYGETFGHPKPKIVDWSTLSVEEYTHRCEEDVKINVKLWKRLRNKLVALYGEGEGGKLSPDAIRLIRYLSFKMKCANDTEKLGIRLDHSLATKMLQELEAQKAIKIEELAEAMPKHALTKRVVMPKNLYKKDGTLTEAGSRWFEHLKKAGLPPTTQGAINVIYDYERANPNSVPQVKSWLYSLGWEPRTFNYEKDNNGNERKIEQVRENGELCESVKELADKDPAIVFLDGLTVINHRIGVFKGFLSVAEEIDGQYWVKSKVDGLTNTFRFKHRAPLANLPGVDKPYGKEIRACLLAPSDDHVLIGADMVSLEDTTKRHYMKPLDPAYVEEMSQDGFDPHLNLAVFAGACSQEDIDLYNEGKKPELKSVRKAYKAANYSAIYGVGAEKLSRSIGCSFGEAKALIEAYWDRNWSIKEVSKRQKTKVLKDGSMWLQNPVSGFWHSLRATKDIFSTLNQSTGVYVFDNWLAYIISSGIPVVMQYHDEYLGYTRKGNEQEVDKINREAIEKLNKRLCLNIDIASDWKYGTNYAEVH